MSLAVGIVGLPNVGKTTLFNALTRAHALVAGYAFSTVEPNTAIVEVPDPRLHRLGPVFKARKLTPASIRFVDVAGLVKGASRGEGMGNRFLAHLRDADALAMVVRCFSDPNVPHIGPVLDPQADVATVTLELILADLELVERRREKIAAAARFHPDSKEAEELRTLDLLRAHLDAGKPARTLSLDAQSRALMRDLALLTAKPILYVANIDETDIGKNGPRLAALQAQARDQGAEMVSLAARLEAEITELDSEDARAFLKEAGVTEPALDPFIRAAFHLLDLITFFTGNENELRAWPVRAGTRALAGAGAVHSDFQRGFIRAEVVGADDLIKAGSYPAAREAGSVRLEGRDYLLRDGDVVLFRFNV